MLIMCLVLSSEQRTYASERERVGNFRSADTQDDTADNNDGFSMTWNNDEGNVSAPIRMMLVLTVLTLAPSIMVLLTSFTRIIVVLHFVRTALGTQTSPPNQVMVGLALFLTLLIMSPVLQQVNENAIQPYDRERLHLKKHWKRHRVRSVNLCIHKHSKKILICFVILPMFLMRNRTKSRSPYLCQVLSSVNFGQHLS